MKTDKVIEEMSKQIEEQRKSPYEDGYKLDFPLPEHILAALQIITKIPEDEIKEPTVTVYDSIINIEWHSNNWAEWDLGEPQIRQLISVTLLRNHKYHKFLWWHWRTFKEKVQFIQVLTPTKNVVIYFETVDEAVNAIIPYLKHEQFQKEKKK